MYSQAALAISCFLLGVTVPLLFDRGRLQKVRVICTGALTNVALLVSLYPEVIPRLEVVLMGGAMGIGNTGPVMEFNIQASFLQQHQCCPFGNEFVQSDCHACFAPAMC